MARIQQRSTWTVDVRQDVLDVTMEHDSIDPKWRGADSNGHEHFYDREAHEYPTLDYIVDARHWCNGDEGIARHDPHWHTDESHYECRICREVVTPGLIPGGTPQYVAGMRYATLHGMRSDGTEIVAELTGEEAEALANVTGSDAQRIIDGIPKERCSMIRVASR
jgi:hypothetical protein